MPLDVDERALFDRFSKRYELIMSDLLQQIERINCGCDYGATSFTTVEQADDLSALLELEPGKRLLEVGAGSGWPGLYLAKATGCDVTLTDLPIEGLQIARQRAQADKLTDITRAVVASGSKLPFLEGWFHAISHSDVLCCLVDKLSVLKSCRKVIHIDGKMVFSVIFISPDLSLADYNKAVEAGPSFMATQYTYPELLHKSGWNLIDQVDLTEKFLGTLKVKLNTELNFADEIKKLLGKDETLLRLNRTRAYIDAIENGLIRRELFHVVPVANR